MTLTEQWKKGELESGVYYIKYRGAYEIDRWHGWYWEDSWSEYVEEVIAPVPSYEEWQELIDKKYWCNARAKNLLEKNQQLRKWCEEFKALDVAKENQQLKSLLKECGNKIEEVMHILSKMPSIERNVTVHSILRKFMSDLDNAIGDKK